MRKLITLSLSLLGLCAWAHNTDTGRFGVSQEACRLTAKASVNSFSRAEELTPEDILGAPEGTVFGGEFSDAADYMGYQNSDQGRTDFTTKFYQHFSGNYYTFNQLRFFGLFNYYDAENYNWLFCDERAGINEDRKMTKPIRFEVSFYKEDADGKPGEVIYTQEFDLLGEDTGVEYGDYQSGFQDIYAFDVDLGKELKLETGFLSVSAVDLGDSPSCWFSLFAASSSVDYGLILWDGDGYQYSSLPMIFYLKGTGDMSARKALKFNRLLAPSAVADTPYERVQIEFTNAGSQPLNDIRLELWADGDLVSTENPGITLGSLELHKYTFTGRVDCSAPGLHSFEIRNVTPGDEKLCAEAYKFTIDKPVPGAVGESRSESCDGTFISNVTLGDIDNTTLESNYSDFTDQKTTIHPGDIIQLSVTPKSKYAYTVAYIDWNGNGILGEKGEFIDLEANNFLVDVKIPDNMTVTEGDKLVRIITTYDTPYPTGVYDIGETEDYTLTVARNPNTPALAASVEIIDTQLHHNSESTAITISNNGSATLTGDLTYTYILPNYPGSGFSTAEANIDVPKVSVVRKAITKAGRLAAPEADANTVYTVRYDNGQYDAIGIENSESSTYAHLYPGNMLASLEGMAITSVDVYISNVPDNNSIVIYGPGTQTKCGELICEQSFQAKADSWNHIVLSTPVPVSGDDLWVGVKMSGFSGSQYHIGIDHGPALRGLGDIVNIGGETWWSMADLGLDYNYCIRANVSGTPTPAISWMTLSNNKANIAAGSSVNYDVTLDASGLDDNSLYEAVIDITTNDELCPKLSIPVYLVNGTFGSLDAVTVNDCTITVEGCRLTVNTQQSAGVVKSLTLFNTAGQAVSFASGSSMDISGLNGGVYFLHMTFDNGANRNLKVLIRK